MSLLAHFAAPVLSGLSAAGMAQAAFGARAVKRFARNRAIRAEVDRPPVTVLKPLHGDEPLLEAALESFFAQDFPEYQLVFGVRSPTDPAIAVVQRLRQRYPGRDASLVIDATRHGANGKISNVINMMHAARHDILMLADSDVHAAPDCIARIVATLAEPGTGVATAVYSGRPAQPGITGAMGASTINHIFLPGALLARSLGRQDCLGAKMAFTRATLAAVGGFAALADHLADDAMLGRLVRANGLAVRLAGTVPATTVAESRLTALVEHEMRWACTIRSLAPVGHALSLVQCPIAWAVLAVLAAGFAPWSLAVFTVAWAARAAAARAIDRAFKLPSGGQWWLPLRDAVSFAEIVASYVTGRVRWRGQVLPVNQSAYVLREPSRASYRSTGRVLGRG